MKLAKGFTLTELVIILAVIITLTTITFTQYSSLNEKNRLNRASHYANEMAIASTINYTECKAGNTAECKKTHSCSDFALLLPKPIPEDMKVILKQGTPFPTEPGQMVECQIIYGPQPADFKAIANP